MTFAFDLDGTANRYPAALGTIMHELTRTGHRVVVLTAVPTGEPLEHRIAMLRAVGIMPGSYSEIVMQADDGRSKGKWCAENNCVMLIDDSQSNLDWCQKASPSTARLRVMP